MGVPTAVPRSPEQLYDNLVKLHENKKYMTTIRLNQNSHRVESELDVTATHMVDIPELRIPIKTSHLGEAGEVVSILVRESENGHAPSKNLAERLFACIDTGRP